MSRTVIYPGSFDPVTVGHLDIITRASKLFGKVIVGVLVNSAKSPIFSVDERISLLREACADLKNVEVIGFNGLLAQYCEEHGIDAIVKGLRAMSDFEYEFQMALTNKKLNPKLETLFLTSEASYMYLSSSIVREVGSMGGEIGNFVPECVHDKIVEKLRGFSRRHDAHQPNSA